MVRPYLEKSLDKGWYNGSWHCARRGLVRGGSGALLEGTGGEREIMDCGFVILARLVLDAKPQVRNSDGWEPLFF